MKKAPSFVMESYSFRWVPNHHRLDINIFHLNVLNISAVNANQKNLDGAGGD